MDLHNVLRETGDGWLPVRFDSTTNQTILKEVYYVNNFTWELTLLDIYDRIILFGGFCYLCINYDELHQSFKRARKIFFSEHWACDHIFVSVKVFMFSLSEGSWNTCQAVKDHKRLNINSNFLSWEKCSNSSGSHLQSVEIMSPIIYRLSTSDVDKS